MSSVRNAGDPANLPLAMDLGARCYHYYYYYYYYYYSCTPHE
jgi:hypothetical protein